MESLREEEEEARSSDHEILTQSVTPEPTESEGEEDHHMNQEDEGGEATDEPLFASERPTIPRVTAISSTDGQDHELTIVDECDGVESHPAKSGRSLLDRPTNKARVEASIVSEHLPDRVQSHNSPFDALPSLSEAAGA